MYEKMQPVYRVMNRLSLLLHAVLACVINFLIETFSRHSAFAAWSYMTGTPLVFLYNAFLIFMTLMLVYLFKRRTFARLIVSVFWLVLGIANGYLLSNRVTPFNAQDLKVIKDGLSLIKNYSTPFEIIGVVVGAMAIIFGLVQVFRISGQYKGKMRRILALAGIIIVAVAYSFITNIAIEKRVISTYFGNIAFAYQDYGMPYCFAASAFNTGIHEPDGYNETAIKKMTDNGELSVVSKEDSTRPTEEEPNIVVVQLESFFDPSEVEFLQTSEDPTPNLHNLFKDYSHGYLKVPAVGAGTVNTEFEVLTGMNLRYFGPGEYPYKTVLKNAEAESAASVLASLGYKTAAIHNNTGNFYSRAQVFDNIGFDSFTSKEFMNVLDITETGWAKDAILPNQIMTAMNQTEERDFVFTITVQSHGDYPEKKVLYNPKIKVAGLDTESEANKWEYYVNQLSDVDEFIGKLISDIEAKGEPTVVAFYGDHLPTLGLKARDLKSRYTFNTNYLIWDNIGLKKEDKNIASYQLMSEVFDRIGYNTGTFFNYHKERKETKNYLLDLELLQYDVLYGNQFAYEKNNPIPSRHMIMGLGGTTLSMVTEGYSGGIVLNGTDFTKYSKVYVNGKKQESTFLNDTLLLLPKTELVEGDTIVVAQVGSSNTIFRASNEYVYENGGLRVVIGTGVTSGVSWQEQNNAKNLE
jgi:phosphoglycerol transferase MdoB-like AlkP superfamily enzyme